MVSRLDRPNPPCVKKERNFIEGLIHNHSQQIFSADFFSRSSQQIFSADFLQQIFSADLLSRFSQQIFSADLLSRSSQRIFSADLLIVLSFAVVRGWWSAIVLSFAVCCGQGLVVNYGLIMLSRSSQQIFSLSYHLLWSGVGGQLLSYHLLRSGVGGQLLSYHVGGLCWWSILHEFFRRTLSRSFREKFSSKRKI